MSVDAGTFVSGLVELDAREEVCMRTQLACLHDLVCQAVDRYATHQNISFGGQLGRRSLGGKLACLDGEGQEDLRSAVGRFRTYRLRLERGSTIEESQMAECRGRALRVVELAGVANEPFRSRVPLAARTVSSVSIETHDGYRSFDVLHADVVRVPSDLLVISTHANPDERPGGQLVNALRKEGVDIDPDRVFQIVQKEWIWTCFQEVAGHPDVRSVLTVRMKKSRGLDDPAAFFDRAVKGVFSSVAALEYIGHEFKAIALPVIYGERIVDYRSAIDSLLTHALVWLKRSAHTDRVSFVVYGLDELEEWNAALNSLLGRSVITPGSDLVLQGVLKEVSHLVGRAVEGPLQAAAVPLLHALDERGGLCIENVCVFGRKLCEVLAIELITRHGMKPGPILMNNIEALGKAHCVAPWICSYMHSLRIFGNQTVHGKASVPYVPKTLDQNDLVAALSAIKSLLLLWQGEFESRTPPL